METVYASTVAEWRGWLAENGQAAKEVWLVIYHKGSGTPSLRVHEAVEQALCFGWIDGLHRKRDGESSRLRFTPRGPRSSWSRVNRERAARLTELGLMTERGQAVIDDAKAKGTWQVVSDAEGERAAEELHTALTGNEAAHKNFEGFPPSSKRLIVEWIAGAKRAETRQRRIERTVELAAVNVRANQPTSTGSGPLVAAYA